MASRIYPAGRTGQVAIMRVHSYGVVISKANSNRYEQHVYGDMVPKLKEWFTSELGECTAVRFPTSMTDLCRQE